MFQSKWHTICCNVSALLGDLSKIVVSVRVGKSRISNGHAAKKTRYNSSGEIFQKRKGARNESVLE